MAVIIPSGYAQVTFVWRSTLFDSGNAATVIGSQYDGDDLEGLAQTWATTMQQTFLTAISSFVVLESVRAVTATESAEVSVNEAGAGGATDLQAPNVAVLVTEVTSRRGRRGRGRMYLPGLQFEDTVTSAGTLDPPYRDDLQDRADAFLQGGTVGARPMVVLQHTTPTGPNAPENPTPPINPPPPVTGLIVQGKVATQRRRLRS